MRRILQALGVCAAVIAGVQHLTAETVGQGSRAPATQPATKIADRAACSTLCQGKQPLDKALKTIADMGYRYVDLSALTFAPHVSVKALLEDFDKEASRVEASLEANRLRIANLTYDSFEGRPFDEYQKQFEALARFAGREKARLINLMMPSTKADKKETATKLKALVAIAKRQGVILTAETHTNQITEQPADALWLCRQVPGLGLTLDPSHFFAGPNQGKPFDELYPYVQGTSFRAGGMSWATVQSPWGTGPIDFDKITRGLEKAGYKGYYVAEYLEGFNQLNAVEESKKFLAWIRRF